MPCPRFDLRDRLDEGKRRDEGTQVAPRFQALPGNDGVCRPTTNDLDDCPSPKVPDGKAKDPLGGLGRSLGMTAMDLGQVPSAAYGLGKILDARRRGT